MYTSITVEFDVNDLEASYEVFGTSDNYSFQEKLGLGSELVSVEGESFVKTIPLKGNYGRFEILVFAESIIGVRSESLVGNIEVLPAELKDTFTFGSINSITGTYTNKKQDKITYSPQSPGDQLIVESEFGGTSVGFNWSLIPPLGHPLEGQSVQYELNNDTFFSGFKLNFKNGNEYIDLSSESLSEASLDSLAEALSTNSENVVDLLQNYEDFEFTIPDLMFQDLNLSRNVSLEVISVDKFGREATGIISSNNPEPVIAGLTESTRGSTTSFSWESYDIDLDNINIEVLAIPEGFSLKYPNDLQASAEYLQSIKLSKEYNQYAGAYYTKDDKVHYNGKIYSAIRSHITSQNETPENSNNWELVGDKMNFNYFKHSVEDDINEERLMQDSNSSNVDVSSFSVDQLWGYDYYYSFQPVDGYGDGQVYNFTNRGLISKTENGATLKPISVNVKIDNLRYREVKDDFVFNWDIVDNQGNLVDINQYKFLIDPFELPSLIGISGSLYDINTRYKITGITEGYNSKSLDFDENGDVVSNDNLPSAKAFDQYKYTRELNNQIYKTGGFPGNAETYDFDKNYEVDDNVVIGLTMYKANSANGNYDPNVHPVYEKWREAKTYKSISSDTFSYKNDIYKTITDFGPDADGVVGLYDPEYSYAQGDIVFCPERVIDKYYASSAYNPGDYIFENQSIYQNIQSITAEEDIGIDDRNYWTRLDIFNELKISFYKSKFNSNETYPFGNSNYWEKLNPKILSDAGEFFDLIVPSYELTLSDWNNSREYNAGDLVVYQNDIWSGTQASTNQNPSSSSSYWTSSSNGQDIGQYSTHYSRNYLSGDLVYSNNFVYECTKDNPLGGPIIAKTNEGDSILSTYEDTNWLPFWELNDQYGDVVFGHIGIPQSGKRSVGLEIGLLDKYGKVIDKKNIDAENPAPYILQEDFDVDNESESEKIKFNFKYALGFQERTSKVYVYRSSDQAFSVTSGNGLPISHTGKINIDGNIVDSPLVKIVVGEADATYGENINLIEDSPPLGYIDDYEKYILSNQQIYEEYILDTSTIPQSKKQWAEDHFASKGQTQGLEMPQKATVTGYYYKLLPFDDFGSGVLHTVRNNEDNQFSINVIPKNFHDPSQYASNGPVVRAKPATSRDGVPLPVENLHGSTTFENYFLGWNTRENDIDFYEVWANREEFNGDQFALVTGLEDGTTGYFEQQNNTGYRRISGPIYSIGDTHPREEEDESWRIVNAYKIFDVAAKTSNVETVYPGKTNEYKNFWIRAVDKAGNKSPFTGIDIQAQDNISGLALSLSPAEATDIDGFELSLTEKFYNTIALNPNNPFYEQDNSAVWMEHTLYHTGKEYTIAENQDGLQNGYVWWQSESGVYNTGLLHPASTNQDFEDGDFIIARINNGIPTLTFNVFANALIGTANIADAAIIDAKINDLKVDKLLAGVISGKDIQITQGVNDAGSIRTAGFTGINYNATDSGFFLSGDGSFGFQAGRGSLSFDGGTLSLRGRLKQSNGSDYDFIDLDVTPNYFNYIEAEDWENAGGGVVPTFIPDDGSPDEIDITAVFRNSSIDPDQVKFKMIALSGSNEHVVFDYNQSIGGDYDISGFHYDHANFDPFQDTKTATATFKKGSRIRSTPNDYEDGFDRIIDEAFPGSGLADSVILYVSGENSSFEKSLTITRINDGKAGLSSKTVDLFADNNSILYDEAGNNPNPTQIQFIGTANNFEDPVFKFYQDGVEQNNDTWVTGNVPNFSNKYSDSFNSISTYEASNRYYNFKIEAKENGEPDSTAVSDTISVPTIKPGDNAYTVILTNENHSIPANSDGNVDSNSYSGSGTDIIVYRGGIQLTAVTSEDQLDFGKFFVEVISGNQNGISVGSIAIAPDGKSIRVGDHSSMVAEYANIIYTIKIEGRAEIEKEQSFTKSLQGIRGRTSTFRGVWSTSKEYVGNDTRGDIVKGVGQYVNDYFIAKADSGGAVGDQEPSGTIGDLYWGAFGGQFESVATDILLTQEAYITDRLIMGKDQDNGYIVSNGFTGGLVDTTVTPASGISPGDEDYGAAGFLLGRSGDAAFFDIGGRVKDSLGQDIPIGNEFVESYLRFSSDQGKIEIRGASVNNTSREQVSATLEANNQIKINNQDPEVDDVEVGDALATFIGGGYNNNIDVPNYQNHYESLASAIVAGGSNTITGRFSFIGAGYGGVCNDNFSAIVAGYQNSMPRSTDANQGANFIGAGQNNVINGGTNQTILGGDNNTINYTL